MSEFLNNIKFANPEFFYLLGLIPLFIIWYIFKNKRQNPEFKFSFGSRLKNIKPTLRQRLRHLNFLFRMLAVALMIVALARPQSSSTKETMKTEGIDIVLALDVSTSMLAEDFKPNRLEAAKETAVEFIRNRKNDRIGLVVFAGESFTQCPVTIDHDILINLMQEIKSGKIEDGTAIGMGLATSVTRLQNSKAKSKIVILLTDGKNNKGFVAPLTAAEIAEEFSVKVYTIGVGTKGKAPYPVQTPFGIRYRNIEVDIDEDILKDIAEATNGKYFRATDNEGLAEIYNEIDKMEKTEIDVTSFTRYSEEFKPFLMAALLFFGLELLLRYTLFRTYP
jgi:Ca-activated chloride channel family protein